MLAAVIIPDLILLIRISPISSQLYFLTFHQFRDSRPSGLSVRRLSLPDELKKKSGAQTVPIGKKNNKAIPPVIHFQDVGVSVVTPF